LYAAGVVLFAHVIIGGIFYWKYAELYSRNKNLIEYNTRLQEDNKRVIELADQLQSLETSHRKLYSLLGVDGHAAPANSREIANRQPTVMVENIVPAVGTETEAGAELFEMPERFFLASRGGQAIQSIGEIPSLLPVKGFLTQDFSPGLAPNGHTGIDIAAKRGSIVCAAGSGQIIFAKWTYQYGNLVVIEHGDGLRTFYGHNQRILKPERSFVKRGEPIALLGSTGKSSGPHLHFEIRKWGKAVDPKDYILAFNENIATNR
jgi:murein DD-endopeptidase MepM/ murein hydrolase activator NlpD